MSSSFLTHRRQDIPVIQEGQVDHQQHHFPFTTSSHNPRNNSPLRYQQNIQYLSTLPLDGDIARLSHSPVSTTESSPATSTLDYDHSTDYYMQRTSQAVQQTIQAARHPSLESLGLQHPYWEQPNNPLGAQPLRSSISSVYHKRNNSDGTIPSAPYTPTSFPQQSFQQPHIVDPEVHQYPSHQDIYDYSIPSLAAIPKSYPQTTQSLTQSAYSVPFQVPIYDNAQSQLHWNAMSHTFVQQQQVPQFHRQAGHEMDPQEELNNAIQDKLQSFPLAKIPGLPRTTSAICEDYNVGEPAIPSQISHHSISRANVDGHIPSPTNSVFSQRLQAASQSHLEAARSASPTATSLSGERSPFRPSMMSAAYEPPTSPVPLMNTAAHLREQQRAEAAAFALANAARRASRESSQTVSPKEVSKEYDHQPENDLQGAMFGNLPTSPHHAMGKGRPSRLNQELTRSSTYDNLSNGEESPNATQVSINQPMQIPQQYPFIRTHHMPGSGLPESSQESNPRFAPTLISMESTLSGSKSSVPASPEVSPYQKEFVEEDEEDEVDEEGSEIEEDEIKTTPRRPGNTRSDGGTYTCTYHGCTQRFETPQKLQKHKKEGHRQGTPSSNADSRLTQAGPHKCERMNPQTGKPCNSIFSRPYDLTRHEDTIHNAKKQKVRCRYCTEEKTFSRNDALTRHMRVVHPDIEFSGRSKRGSR